jgi:hypothetical protein
MEPLQLVIRNTSEVLTCEGTHREPAEQALTPRPGACVGVRDGRVAFIGPESELPRGAVGPSTEVLDAEGQLAASRARCAPRGPRARRSWCGSPCPASSACWSRA